MRKIAVVFLLVCLQFSLSAEDIITTTPDGRRVILYEDWTWEYIEESEGWTKTAAGDFTVERFWVETTGSYTCSYTIVRYRNNTDRIFDSAVTIQAEVLDSTGHVINMNTRSFFAYDDFAANEVIL